MTTSVDLPRIRFTDEAHAKLAEIIDGHANPVAGLRLQITGRADGIFHHLLSLVEEGAQIEGDTAVDAGGLTVFIDPRASRYLDNVEVHFREVDGQPALEFHNPNPLWFDSREFAIQELIDRYINPQIAAHGGRVELLGVEDRTAFVEFGGGCVGCGMISMTLKQGVEAAVKEHVPDIEEIIDSTDHASGRNPYYRPAPAGGHHH